MKDSKVEQKEKEPQTNMWKDILREAMSKKELEDANIFIFGDQLTGEIIDQSNKQRCHIQKCRREQKIFKFR